MADQQAGHSHAVDIVALAQELRAQRVAIVATSSAAQVGSGPPIIIAEVGDLTRNVDKAEYVPQYVTIGPYHRNLVALARDDDKMISLHNVMSAASPGATEACLEALKRLEARARRCYASSLEGMESREFLRMLLLDACYVLDWFGNVVVNGNDGAPAANGRAEGAYQDSSAAAAPAAGGGSKLEALAVVRDVFFLVENQIPFFVVDTVHRLLNSPPSSRGVVLAVDAIAGYVSRYILQKQQYSVSTMADVALAQPAAEPGNLLHLLYLHFLKPDEPSPPTSEQVGRWRTATEYNFAGVKLKSRPVGRGANDARCILDVKLDRRGRTLEVPRLHIDAETWRILRNLMALEQQNLEAAGSHVTAYCIFVSQVACTARDVDLLSRRGIIVHRLGNHGEVAALFSDLCKGVMFDADDPDWNYLLGACQALDKQIRSRPGRWMALLVQKYFANPWLAVGVVAAAIGLACTVLQAVYAVLSYKQGAAK